MKTMFLEDWEVKALRYFLEAYGQDLGNAGCNDLPDELEHIIPKKAALEINRAQTGDKSTVLMDFQVVQHLRDKIP